MSRNFDTVKPRFWVILCAALLAGAALLYFSQQRYIDRQRQIIADLELERDELIAYNAALQDEIDFTYTDRYIEREAHGMGLVHQDEILYQSNDVNTLTSEKKD